MSFLLELLPFLAVLQVPCVFVATLFVKKSDLADHHHRYSLAYAEMYLTLAVLFRANGPKLELFETDESDVLNIHDYHQAMPKLSTKGIRVVVC